MVAIHIPRRSEGSWTGGSAEPVRPAPAPVLRLVSSPLPDRATRVRRRRLALLVAAVVLAAIAALAVQAIAGLARVDGSAGPEAVELQPMPVAGQRYIVQPGDTLWSIATEIAPDDDPRAVVDALRDANGGPELEVGDELILVRG
jgi:Tfp pilus assembly protein FimV